MSAIWRHCWGYSNRLSQRLAVLCCEGLVETHRDAKQVFYRMSSPPALAVIQTLYQQFCAGETP